MFKHVVSNVVGDNTAAQLRFHGCRHVLIAAAVNLLAFSVRLGQLIHIFVH